MGRDDLSENNLEKSYGGNRSPEVSFNLRHSPFYQKAVQNGKRNNLTKKTGQKLSPTHPQETSFLGTNNHKLQPNELERTLTF